MSDCIQNFIYCKVVSSKMSGLEAYAGFFRLLMKGIFDPYVLCPFDKKLVLISNACYNLWLYGRFYLEKSRGYILKLNKIMSNFVRLLI